MFTLPMQQNRMFKPTLKRKYLPTHTQQTSYHLPQPHTQVIEVEVPEQKVSIVPSVLLDSANYVEKVPSQVGVSPLSCRQCNYPEQVSEGLKVELAQSVTRSIGYGEGVHWFFTHQQLILWNYYPEPRQAQVHYCLRKTMRQPIYAVTIGYLTKVGVHFSSDCVLLCAVGMASYIDLFSLDLPTFQLSPLNMRMKMEYGQSLQKVQMLENVLYVVGDAAYITTLHFCGPVPVKRVHRPKKNFLQFSRWKCESLWGEKLLVGRDRVYVLVRKHTHVSWWSIKYQQLRHLMRGEKWQECPVVAHKQIHVYRRVKGGCLVFERIVRDEQIRAKVLHSYAKFKHEYKEQSEQKQALSIVSIYLDYSDNNNQNVGMATKYGYTIVLNNKISQLSFVHEPKEISLNRMQPEDGMRLFQSVKPTTNPKKTHLLYSFGGESLNITENSIILNMPYQQHVIKMKVEAGHVIEVNEKVKKWIVFTKNNLTFVQKMTVEEILVTYLCAKKHIIHHRYEVQKQFLLKMEQLSGVYGRVQLCHALYSLLEHYVEWKANCMGKVYAVNCDLRLMADRDLRKEFPPSYREWYYFLGRLTTSECYQIGQNSGEEVLKLVCQYQHQHDNRRIESRNDGEGMGSCWWICLRERMYQIISPALSWRPKAFVLQTNRRKKEKVIHQLQLMQYMLKQKERTKKKIENDLMFMSHSILESQQKLDDIFSGNPFLQKQNHKTSLPICEKPIQSSLITFNYPTESVQQLTSVLCTVTPKLLSLVSFYEILAECDRIDQFVLPTFYTFITNLRERQMAKNMFVDSVGCDTAEKINLLRRFDREVPELDLHHNIRFHQWFCQSSLENAGNFSMQYIAKNLSTQLIKRTQSILSNHPHKYLELLLERLCVVEANIKATRSKIQNNDNNGSRKMGLKSKENQKMLKQLAEFTIQEQCELDGMINQFIIEYAKKAHQEKGMKFRKMEKEFDCMLGLLSRYSNQSFFLKLSSFMKQYKIMLEKIFAYNNKIGQFGISAISQNNLTRGEEQKETMELIRIYEVRHNVGLAPKLTHNETSDS